MAKIDRQRIKHVAKLANIPITETEAEELASAFSKTLTVIDELQKLSVDDIEPTHQVTGLTNVTRDDVIEEDKMFTQEQALANAHKTHQGYFVVPRILEK